MITLAKDASAPRRATRGWVDSAPSRGAAPDGLVADEGARRIYFGEDLA
jgi:hypothetical protein